MKTRLTRPARKISFLFSWSTHKNTSRINTMKVEKRRILQSDIVHQLAEQGIGENDLDDTVLDYLLELVSDPNSWNDEVSLTETIASFLDGNEKAAKSIIETLSDVAASSYNNKQDEKITATLLEPRQALFLEATVQNDDYSPLKETESSSNTPTKKSSSKSRRELRKQRKIEKKQKKSEATIHEENVTEDDASAWQQCRDEGLAWGGRSRGGRGEYAGAVNSVNSNIHLTNVTVALPNGSELLTNATIDIEKGRR